VCGNVVDLPRRCDAHLLSLQASICQHMSAYVSICQHTSARAQHWRLREQHERFSACRHCGLALDIHTHTHTHTHTYLDMYIHTYRHTYIHMSTPGRKA
jgi:hypothetical protein